MSILTGDNPFEQGLEEKRGLWDNIHAKRKRIKAGSGEKMRTPGSDGAPSDKDLKDSQVKEGADEVNDKNINAIHDKDEGEATDNTVKMTNDMIVGKKPYDSAGESIYKDVNKSPDKEFDQEFKEAKDDKDYNKDGKLDKHEKDHKDEEDLLKSLDKDGDGKHTAKDHQNEDFETNFKKRISATVKGGKGAQYLDKKAKEKQDANPDKGKGLGPRVLDTDKARKKAAKKGVKAGSLRSSPDTSNPKRLPEGYADEIMESVVLKAMEIVESKR